MDGVDNLFTSDEEKLILRNKLQEAMNEYNTKIEELALQHEQEITKRWESDNEHLLTRRVRPLSYTWVVVVFTLIAIGDGNFGFNIQSEYIPVFSSLLMTMTVAYFGMRSFDKHSKNKHK